MFAISSLLLLSAAPIAALMAIGKPKGERAAPFRAGAHAKDGADRLFCFARKLRVGVPTRPVAWGDRGGEKSPAKQLRPRSGRNRRPTPPVDRRAETPARALDGRQHTAKHWWRRHHQPTPRAKTHSR